MIGEYESLGKVLRTIEVKEGLNKDNIIEEIKTELEKQDQGLYKNWEEGKFDVNYVFPLFFCECTLLTIAAENGHASVVEVLLKAEANVNAVDSNKWFTPLHVAAENGHASVVEVLLKAEANVNAVGIEGCTPLHFAAGNGHVDIVNLLLEKGANVNAVDRYGKTPLDYAEGYAKNQDVVKALLDARGGSFVKARNKAMIAGGVNTLLGTAIAVALFTTGTITAQLIPIVIAVVAVTAAALVVGCATYELLKPSTKVDGAEKPIVNSINEQQRVTSISSY
ncbi:ankyrin repeat domain protein [Wolbachia endosymbiont of Culex quinquefasciatus JHB]|nr:ankyrin repeat domain-containing protein [Wolbachia endosymbiont of Culex quinquefasciatus]EEB55644.1 ankyrin repeat domain protein [Wolbachia endosymbiont of Culex quinquefasciatus JHB]